MLYDLGLPAALAWLGEQMEQQHELRVEVVGNPAGFVLDEARAILAFQCVRELLWNVVKHGATKEARVSYELKNGELTSRSWTEAGASTWRRSKAKPAEPRSSVCSACANVWNFIKVGWWSNRRRGKELQ